MSSGARQRRHPRARPRDQFRGAARPIGRQYQFNAPGLLYIAVTVFLAIGAFNGQNNLLYWAFGVSVAGLIASGVISGTALMGVGVSRRIVGREHRALDPEVGREFEIEYRLSNRNGLFPAFALTVTEIADNERGARGGDSGAPALWNRFLQPSPAFVAHVGPREAVVTTATALALRRGETKLRVIAVSSTFPFGLVRKTILFEQPQRVLVRPAAVPLAESLIAAIRQVGNLGSSIEQRVGNGEDFFGLRDYQAGDPPRWIAWKPTARLDTLVVKQHSMPTPPRLWLTLEEPTAGTDDAEVEVAVALAASIIQAAADRGHAVGLLAPWAGIGVPVRAGRAHVTRLIHDLARLRRDAPRQDRIAESVAGLSKDSRFRIVAGIEAAPPGDRATVLRTSEPDAWLAANARTPKVIIEPDATQRRKESA